MGIQFSMLHILLQGIGITTLKCNRSEPSAVACERRQTGYFDFVKQPLQIYSGITSATVQTRQVNTGLDGKPVYSYWATVEANGEQKTLVEAPAVVIYNSQDDQEQIDAIDSQLNQFIQSDELNWMISRDNRQRANSFLTLAALLLGPAIIFTLLYCTLQSEELVFDREQGLLLRQRKTLLGTKHQQIPLHKIETTEIKAQRGKRTYYQLNLLPKSLKTRSLMRSRHRDKVAEIEAKVQRFLTY